MSPMGYPAEDSGRKARGLKREKHVFALGARLRYRN